jgi:hypothetical protein
MGARMMRKIHNAIYFTYCVFKGYRAGDGLVSGGIDIHTTGQLCAAISFGGQAGDFLPHVTAISGN